MLQQCHDTETIELVSRQCVWDEFSEYLLETRFLTSANYDTHPLRFFFPRITKWFCTCSIRSSYEVVGSLFNQSMKIQIIYVSIIIQHVPFEMMMLCCFMSLSYTYKGIRHMQEVSYYHIVLPSPHL